MLGSQPVKSTHCWLNQLRRSLASETQISTGTELARMRKRRLLSCRSRLARAV